MIQTPGSPQSKSKRVEQFSLPLFLLTVGASLAVLALMLKLVAPAAVWHAQLGATVGGFATAFLAITLFNCFVEYVFHRYVLHKPVVPFLSQFYRQHTLHHNLTRIARRRTPGGMDVPFVENIYPITTLEQGEASFFPWYTLAVFAAIVTPLLALLQWLTPSIPWFFAGYAALAGSIMLYEIFHAIEHWSFATWAPLIEHRQLGWFWRKVYSFHLRHHAVIDCNEAISGFFTLPVADVVLGTFILPKSLYADGQEWQAAEFTSPRPCALIRWCDENSDALIKRRRARAQTDKERAAAAPPEYTRGERIAHALTHGAGLGASLGALVLLVTFAILRGNSSHVGSAFAFGVALVALYAALVNFRRVRTTHWRELFHKYNHAAALLLIAGTATPFLVGNLPQPWGWSLLVLVWALCLTGAACRLAGTEKLRGVSRYIYALLAMLGLVALKPMIASVPAGALWLLLAGGLCYATGTVFHLLQRMRYHQVVRHAFVLGGSACHLVAVMYFVLPVRV
jgi:hemolysin III